MKLDKLKEILGTPPKGEWAKYFEIDDVVGFGKLIAIQVVQVNKLMDVDEDIDLKIDGSASPIGMLCLCHSRGNAIPLAEMTDHQYAACLADITSDNFEFPFRFRKDYVVLEQKHLNKYKKRFAKGSTLWGGIVHDQPGHSRSARKMKMTELLLRPNVKLPTPIHKEMIARTVLQDDMLEKWLSMYQVLELSFDLHVVNRIKELKDNLKEIGHILSEYSSNELNLLKNLLHTKCKDTVKILAAMNKLFDASEYLKTAEEIFQDYGKDGNPLKESASWQRLFRPSKPTPLSIAAIKKIYPKKTPEELNEFAINLCAYWIYRIRCCLAHRRIGEYVITSADEEFMHVVMEPLLREVLLQVFSK
jgi:hypothetical protein